MIQIPVTVNGNSEFDISLDGTVYTFRYTYNTRNKRVYLSIFLEGEPIIESLRLIEDSTPILYYPLAQFTGGELLVVEFEKGTGFTTLGNFGINLEYSLVYVSPSEFVGG